MKVKIGDCEFEAEGPTDVIREQFESFKQMVSSVPLKPKAPPISIIEQTPQNKDTKDENSLPQYDKVFKMDGRVVSLTALPATSADAILMIVLAQRHYRKNESVTGSEIMDGLQQSGYTVERIDRQMDKYVGDGLIIRIGKARGTRYRMTNQGLLKAQVITTDVIATVP